MKIKIIFFCIGLLNFNLSHSQKTAITGRILDAKNNDPVFGAYISVNTNQVAISDDLGNYQFMLTTINPTDSVCISHIAYGKNYYKLSDFKNRKKFELTSKINLLDEVIVHNNLSDDAPILKSARTNFDKLRIKSNYWSGLNLKQVTKYKDTAQSYLEVVGHVFMVGSDEKNPFVFGFIIPSEVRRTKESKSLQEISRNFNSKRGMLQSIGHEWTNVLLNYKFFELAHPLSKRGRNKFVIRSEKTEWIDNNEYYVLEYKQVKKLKLKTRYLKNMYGKIWIDKIDNSIFKETTYFDFENISSQNFSIFYKKIKDHVYPYKAVSNVFHHNYSHFKAGFNVKSIFSFYNIDVKERENYRKLYGLYQMDAFFTKIDYNKPFWDKYNLSNNPMSKDIEYLSHKKDLDTLFSEGATSEIYIKKHPLYGYLQSKMPQFKAIENLMKKDLKLK
ncbi:hypothetical protein UMM65_15840 [Aureibaculum sp. 2210JD6-5]|uniref:hypothetical protein n=1 Tax=Aureibaculum sp. 2210JD6-5 TaxID=3103957 RepID=UPI002AAC6F53|nr:hypothetical protein [Aureibaculum sp. 2210JD6-5]MDY7396720.1 hypothetical protein [Aureibaculum sp. 2210JD6-5]